MTDLQHYDDSVAYDVEFLDRAVTVAFGDSKSSGFVNKTMTVHDLVMELGTFEIGPKDGRSLLGGALKQNGQRTADAMAAQYVAMLDIDNGMDLHELVARVAASQLFCLLWTTHSHGGTSTTLTDVALDKWRKNTGNIEAVTDALIQQYFIEVKHTPRELASTMTVADRGAGKYILHHHSWPKARLLFVLDEPFPFDAANTDKRAEWADRLRGLAKKLGVHADRACFDPSRLMYTPRISARPADTSFNEVRNDAPLIMLFNGAPLTLSNVERVASASHTGHLGAGRRLTSNSADIRRDVREFSANYGWDFEITDFIAHHEPDRIMHERENGGYEIYCPNRAEHTDQEAVAAGKDRGAWALNASLNDRTHHFVINCLHNSCAEMTDTAMLQALLEDMNLTVSDCLKFCPVTQERLAANAVAVEKLPALIDSCSRKSTVGEVKAVAAMIATLVDEDARLDYITELVGRCRPTFGKKDIKRWVETEVEKSRPELQWRNEGRPAHEPPEDLTKVEKVYYTHWGFDASVKAAQAIFHRKNTAKPFVYRVPAGPLVRVLLTENGVVQTELSPADWMVVMVDNVPVHQFNAATGADVSIAPPQDLIKYVSSKDTHLLPLLKGVATVPLVSPTGVLRTQDGYDKELAMYIDTRGFTPLPVPSKLTEADVTEARELLMDIIRDFPFTDVYEGADPQPIKVGDPDEAGYRQPNWERGKAARANAIAMILQPHLRHLIAGPAPLYHVDKPSIGTGSSLLAALPCLIFDGREPSPLTPPANKEKLEEMLLAFATTSDNVMFLDNVNERFDSGAFASMLTSGKMSGRAKYSKSTNTYDMRALMILTGNNVPLTDEMVRRVCPIKLDAEVANPHLDRGKETYKHQDLTNHLKENRAIYVWACQVLIKNWVDKGANRGDFRMESFLEWSGIMSGVLRDAGINDFMANVMGYSNDKKDDFNWETETVQSIAEAEGNGIWKSKDLADREDVYFPLKQSERSAGVIGSLLAKMHNKYYEIEANPMTRARFKLNQDDVRDVLVVKLVTITGRGRTKTYMLQLIN